jgi:cyclophilin family peptidyl-prolyl cis-trans isomerase/plastocyanin
MSAAGDLSFQTVPANTLDPALEYSAYLHTSLGAIQIELAPRSAPEAVNNFVCLAKAGFYDGTPFFRAIPGLLIQGGDPTGTGTGNPGYTFGVETIDANYPAGVIAYANSAPDQNGSQFFIAVSDLDGAIATDFPVFGRVVDGMNIVEKIAQSNIQATYASPATDQPGVVILESVEIIAHPPVAGPFITPSLEGTVIAAATQPAEAAGALQLDAKDIAFVPTELTIQAADEPVTITMKNTGAALHNFAIDALDIDVDVNPGETVEIVIPAGTAPGTYDFYCNVPGHKEAGMVGTLTVE